MEYGICNSVERKFEAQVTCTIVDAHDEFQRGHLQGSSVVHQAGNFKTQFYIWVKINITIPSYDRYPSSNGDLGSANTTV